MDIRKKIRSVLGNSFSRVRNHHGAVAVIVAICLVMLIGFAALAVDMGWIYNTRNELQNVADAASLAGAGFLGSEYLKDASIDDQQNHVFNKADIVKAVTDVAILNKAAGANIIIDPNDVIVGIWDGNEINPVTLTAPDAVQVIARRDETGDNPNNPITTFFARIFGVLEKDVIADATAALTGPEQVAQGELNTPWAISEKYLLEECGEDIIFYPTGESCAGWHNFDDAANANAIANKLLGFIVGFGGADNAYYDRWMLEYGDEGLDDGLTWLGNNFDNFPTTPEVTPGVGLTVFNFIGGTLAACFNGHFVAPEAVFDHWDTSFEPPEPVYISNPYGVDTVYDGDGPADVLKSNGDIVPEGSRTPAPVLALFDFFRYRDFDNNPLTWTATVPVYEDETWQNDPYGEDCMNPNTSLNIIAYATITIRKVVSSPDNLIVGDLTCGDIIVEGRGGGGLMGNTKGSVPSLVE